jgi:hypothetical protein
MTDLGLHKILTLPYLKEFTAMAAHVNKTQGATNHWNRPQCGNTGRMVYTGSKDELPLMSHSLKPMMWQRMKTCIRCGKTHKQGGFSTTRGFPAV